MRSSSQTKTALSEVAATFGPFGLLLSAALLVPEGALDVNLGRAIYTVWVSILFAIPAFVLYALNWGKTVGRRPYIYWKLLWTFAYLAYAVHFYYAFFVIYRASAETVLEQQTPFVGISNFVFTVWWSLDVALLWLNRDSRLIYLQRNVFQIFSFLVYITAFVFLRPGMPLVFGMALALGTTISLLIRFLKDDAANSKPSLI